LAVGVTLLALLAVLVLAAAGAFPVGDHIDIGTAGLTRVVIGLAVGAADGRDHVGTGTAGVLALTV